MNSRSSLENHTRFQTKIDKVYIRFSSDQNGTKTLPFGAEQMPWYRGSPNQLRQLEPYAFIWEKRRLLYPSQRQ